MDRNVQKIGWVNLAACLLVGIASQWLASYSGSTAGQVGVIFLGLGSLIAALSLFQMRLATQERLEKMDLDQLRKGAGSGALFESTAAELFPARRSRDQFDRFFVPAFAIGLFILEGLLAYELWRWMGQAAAPKVDQATITMALMAVFALILFLLGKYSAGIARLEDQILLRPGSSYLLLGSLICILVAVTEAVMWFGYPQIDRIMARILTAILGLVAIETLVNLVLEIYRPRLKGQAVRLLYESRLVGLLGQPGGLITTAAQALDYQFGFKVSETWIYQFLERAVAWIILLQLGVLFVSTTVVVIEPQEQGLLERFGRPLPQRPVLSPGLHFKWPWPVDRVHRYRSHEVQTLYIGFVPEPEQSNERVLVWTKAHYKQEFNLLVASREGRSIPEDNGASRQRAVPVNLLSVNIPVQYRIRDLRAWVYHHANAAQLLEELANREVVRYLVNVDIEALMTTGRLMAARTLQERLQAQADKNHLGAEVLFVGLQGIHPPVKVADAYEAVAGAKQQRQTNILAAWAYRAGVIPLAEAAATNVLARAASEAFAKTNLAIAQAGQFTNQLVAYLASPSVYTQRVYLDTMVRAIDPARKYILAATNTHEVFQLNLEDKIREDLLGGATLQPEGKP